MKCYACGGEYKEIKGVKFRIDDKMIGTFYVDNFSYLECTTCKERLFDPQEVKRLEVQRKKKLNEILQSNAIREFLSAAETSELLGISRQALNKHRRISRGFIYQTDFGGKKVYLKRSVDLFLAKEDGRFVLREPDPVPVKYEQFDKVDNFTAGAWSSFRQSHSDRAIVPTLFSMIGSSTTKEVSYVTSK